MFLALLNFAVNILFVVAFIFYVEKYADKKEERDKKNEMCGAGS